MSNRVFGLIVALGVIVYLAVLIAVFAGFAQVDVAGCAG